MIMLEPWVFIAFVSGLLSNTSNFLHRFLLKDDRDPALYTWFLQIVRLAVAIIFLAFNFYLVFSLKTLFLLVVLGIVEALSMYIYMKQHAFASLSISTIISRTRLIWTALFAFIFLGEQLSVMTYAGIAVLFLGLSVGTAPHKIMVDRGMKYAYLSAIFISVLNNLFKTASAVASAPVIVAAMAIPTIIGYPIIMKKSRQRIKAFFQAKILHKTIAALANVGSLFFLLWAISLGPVSVVNAIYQGTMIFAILAGIIFLKERDDIAKKLIGTAIALVGVMLLSF
jgi:uncharacterized membrane protein